MPISSLPEPLARMDAPHSQETQQEASLTTRLVEAAAWKTANASPPAAGLSAAHRKASGARLAPMQPRPVIRTAPGAALDASDRRRLAERIDPALLDALSNIRLRPGLCQADATFALVKAAGAKIPPELQLLGTLAGGFGAGSAIADLLDAWAPLIELANGRMRACSVEALREQGMPPDCLAVLLYERHGGRMLAVLDVDTETGRSLCLHAVPGDGKAEFSKIDIGALEAHVALRACLGMAAIVRPQAAGAAA